MKKCKSSVMCDYRELNNICSFKQFCKCQIEINKKCHDCSTQTTRIVKIPMCQSCLVDYLNDYPNINSEDLSLMNIYKGEDYEECEKYIQKICEQVGIELEEIN